MPGDISNYDLDRIREELAAGHKIEAIKLYRTASGADLAEAKRFVESLAVGAPAGGAGTASTSNENAEAIQAALFAGQKIQAIKLHRAATGKGLKESKDFIDALDAELRRTQPSRFTAPAAKGCGTTVIVVLIGIGVFVRYIVFG